MKNFLFKTKLLPNILTIIRLFLIPIFIWAFLYENGLHRDMAGYIFIISALTDFLDGYLARRFKSETDMGKVLDPLADKLLVISSLVLLVNTRDIPIWILIVLFLRETILIGGSALIIKRKDKIITPSIWGKIATATILIGLSALLLKIDMGRYFLYFGVIVSLISGVDYILKGLKMLSSSNGC